MLLSYPLDYLILGSALVMIVGLLVAMWKEWKQLGEDDND